MDESKHDTGQGEELCAEGMVIICDRQWVCPYFNKQTELSVEGMCTQMCQSAYTTNSKGRKY